MPGWRGCLRPVQELSGEVPGHWGLHQRVRCLGICAAWPALEAVLAEKGPAEHLPGCSGHRELYWRWRTLLSFLVCAAQGKDALSAGLRLR